jgi:hypothetical protein
MSKFFIYGILPPLDFGARPDITSRELYELLELNLSPLELKKVRVLKLWIDISNLFALFNDHKFDQRGNYSRSTIKSMIANEEDLPDYVFEFYRDYENDQERRKFFPKLISRYFEEEKNQTSGYLAEFLAFEHDFRLLVAGYRAKNSKVDLAKELQFADQSDPIVTSVLMQANSSGKFQFPAEYDDLERVVEESEGSPLKQYEGLANYRFQFYIKYFNNHVFSLEGVLGYMVALWILEDFFALNKEEGESYLSNIVERENVS